MDVLRRALWEKTHPKQLNILDVHGKSYAQIWQPKSYALKAKITTTRKTITWKDKIKKDPKKIEYCHNLITQLMPEEHMRYDVKTALVLCRIMDGDMSFMQQHILQRGLKIFGQKGYDTAMDEIK